MYVAIIMIGIAETRLLECNASSCEVVDLAAPVLQKYVTVDAAANILEWMETFGYKRLEGDQNIIEFLVTGEKETALFLLKHK